MKFNIENYENMTAEEKVAALENYEPDMSGFVSKDIFDKTASDLAKYKKDYQTRLTEDELAKQKAEEERTQMLEQIDKLTRINSIAENEKKYLGLGYSAELAHKTAVAMADGKMDEVFANQATFLKEREKALKAELLKDFPEPPAGGKDKALTKEEFKKLSLDEQMKVYEETPELYAELTK